MAEWQSENWAGLLDADWIPGVQITLETWGIAGGELHHASCEELPDENEHSSALVLTFEEAKGIACRECLTVTATSPAHEVELAHKMGQIAKRAALGIDLLRRGDIEEARWVGEEIEYALEDKELVSKLNVTFPIQVITKIVAGVKLARHCGEVATLQEEDKVVILPSESALWKYSSRTDLRSWTYIHFWDEFENLATGERIFEEDLGGSFDIYRTTILTPVQAGVALARGAFGARVSLQALLREGKIAIADKNIDPQKVRLAGDIMKAGADKSPWSMEDALEAAGLASSKRQTKGRTQSL